MGYSATFNNQFNYYIFMKRLSKDKDKAKRLARKQVKELFEKAENVFSKDPEESNKLVKKARRVAMKNKIRLPQEWKRRICKHCYSFLVPNKNCRVRIRDGKVTYFCLNCKKFMRFPVN